MKSKSLIWFIFAMILFTSLQPTTAAASQHLSKILSDASSTRMVWAPTVPYETAVLTVSGPNGFYLEQSFASGEQPFFETYNPDGTARPAGSYTFEIKLTPVISEAVKANIAAESDPVVREMLIAELAATGALPTPSQLIMSGYLTIQDGLFLSLDVEEPPQEIALAAEGEPIAPNDQQILDDLIVDGSACIGQDCVNGESFGFDTLRLKENNLRIRAVDTSNSASFPTRDWQITFNDSSNGGANKFSIDDIDGGRTPFTIEAGAPSHSLYVDDGGRIGFGTATPAVDLHVVTGNTPTLRLQQDGSSGFSAQTWDMAGNEANFFIRDVSNGSTLPFKILPGAPHDSLVIEGGGDVGIGIKNPTAPLHVRSTDGTGNLFVQETSAAFSNRSMMTLENNGGAFASFNDSSTNVGWSAGSYTVSGSGETNYVVTLQGSGGFEFLIKEDGQVSIGPGSNAVFVLSPTGNLTIDGVLSDASSRELKENFVAVDSSILDGIMALPIYFYNYKSDDASILHVGPTAEAFAETFNVGANNKYISPRDLAGVAIAGVQAVQRATERHDSELAALQDELAAQEAMIETLEEQNAALEARLAALEALVLSQDDETADQE